MHKRRAILEAVRAQLLTVSGFAGVWIQRIGPSRLSYPCVTLNAVEEQCETLTIHLQPRPQERHLMLAVNAWIRGTQDDEKAEYDMDAAALLIEGVMVKPAGCSDILLIATDFKVDEMEPEIHVCTLTYRISYTTLEFTPTS